MNLYIATMLVGAIYFLLGAGFFFKNFQPHAMNFLRSQRVAYILGGIAIAWFMWILYNLGEADFGQYRHLLMLLFGGAGLLAFKYLPDFLSVRALCVILILTMRECVDAAFMQEPASRIVMVTLAYMLVVACIYFGCLPYKLRDLFNWLFEKPMRARGFAIVMCLFALATDVALIFYLI